MELWAPHFTVIAPDTPGYGQSDPLPADMLSIEDIAGAVIEFADAIGVRQFGTYGFHTGASIGTALAHRHPARVTALVANGFVVLTDAERADILARYLPPLVPTWDGSHLAWLWGRVREQTVFFPWYEHRLANRVNFDMPDAESLQESLLDFLRAGDNYHVAYRAAFAYRGELALPELRVPTLLTAAGRDPLASHLQRVGQKSASVRIRPCDEPAEILALALEHLRKHPGPACEAAPVTAAIDGQLWSEMITTPTGQTRVRRSTSGRGRPVVVLHDAGGSADTAARWVEDLPGRFPIVVAELPGHGESEPSAEPAGPTVRECSINLRDLLSVLGLDAADIIGAGAGGLVAAGMLHAAGTDRNFHLTWIDVPLLGEEDRQAFWDEGIPGTHPAWHGGHLLLSWHLVRDGRMFFPWFRRTCERARQIESDLDEFRLQLECRELLKATGGWQNLCRDVLGQPLRQIIGNTPLGTSFAAAADSAWLDATRSAAKLAPGGRFHMLRGAPREWLRHLLTAQGTPLDKSH